MTKEIEQRLDRLEAWAARTFGVTLHEFDTDDQAKAHAKQQDDERKAGERAHAAAVKQLEGGNV